MLQRTGDPRLAVEALAEAGILGELGGDDLDRGTPAEVQVLGTVDQAHAAARDQLLDPVTGENSADMRVCCRVRHHGPVWMTTFSPPPASLLSAGLARR